MFIVSKKEKNDLDSVTLVNIILNIFFFSLRFLEFDVKRKFNFHLL